MNIILTGFMGTGKTAVGQRLAEMLGYGFVDTDELIEERDGRSIPQIFAESGEGAFRTMEREAALDLANRGGLVISTGGRLMLDPVNAAALSGNGRVFCLTARLEEILLRLSAEGVERRPLLARDDPSGRIGALLEERQDGYGQFEQVATDGLGMEEVAKIIFDIVQGKELE